MKHIIFLLFGLMAIFVSPALANSTDLTRADLSAFFEHIYFLNGKWEFKLAATTQGQVWRVKSKTSDVTSACHSGEILNVQPGAEVWLAGKDRTLYLKPTSPIQFWIRLVLNADAKLVTPSEGREAYLIVHGTQFQLAYARD